MSASEPITVSLLDRDYQFACPPDQRDALKQAAEHLDERLREVKAGGRLVAMDRIAIMAALNLAADLLALQQTLSDRAEQVDGRIRSLADELDHALKASMD